MTCEIVKKTSQKTGKEYYVIEIKITDNYTKYVYLERAEKALIHELIEKQKV